MSLHVRSDRLETSVDAFLYRNLLEPALYPRIIAEGEVEAGPLPHCSPPAKAAFRVSA